MKIPNVECNRCNHTKHIQIPTNENAHQIVWCNQKGCNGKYVGMVKRPKGAW